MWPTVTDCLPHMPGGMLLCCVMTAVHPAVTLHVLMREAAALSNCIGFSTGASCFFGAYMLSRLQQEQQPSWV